MEPSRELAVGDFRLDGPACSAYRPRLLRFYRKRRVPDSEQEDLTQTVLAKVLPKEGRFPSEKARDTYVFKAAENVWKDWHEKQIRTGALGLDEAFGLSDERHVAAEPPALESRGTLQRVLDKEAEDALREAMADLPPKMRSCVVLRIYQDRSLREIAQLLRIDVNTVKSHLGQAKELLSKRLGRKFGIIPIA